MEQSQDLRILSKITVCVPPVTRTPVLRSFLWEAGDLHFKVKIYIYFTYMYIYIYILSSNVIHQEIDYSLPRSSSGFCENFAGRGSSNVGQMENSRSEHIVNSASFYLDVNNNGDLVTRALADLDLSSSIELLSAGGYNHDNQLSIISCDTAELLRTPSPCVVESDQEVEPAAACASGMQAQEQSSGENGVKAEGEQDQWAASNHNENSQGFSIQMDRRSQSDEDVPATSTPKKRIPSDVQQILEGKYKGSAYHRDGTRVGGYHSNHKCILLFNFSV